ncbi:MAG TPA: ribonuclease HI family protein [Candidatus Paceibacterota bacterium]
MGKDKLFESKITVHTDGGSRGNPGPAAIGVVIGGKEYGEYLGVKTNNQAEYQAVVFAFKKMKQILGKKKTKETEVIFKLDSELVVKQINGQYKILEPDLQPLFLEIWNARLDFKKVEFSHVPREENKIADKIVNHILDKEKRTSYQN